MNNFHHRLKAARQKKYSSARRFALAHGLHHKLYQAYERGSRRPSIDTLALICKALAISPAKLLTDEDEDDRCAA